MTDYLQICMYGILHLYEWRKNKRNLKAMSKTIEDSK